MKTSTEKAAKASRENGKLGGRPKGYAAKVAETLRANTAGALSKAHPAIMARAIQDAKNGDKHARDWIYEYAFGKAVQPTTVSDPNGDPLFKPSDEDRKNAARALAVLLKQ